MKQLFKLLLLLALLLPATASAYDFMVGGIYYNIIDNEVSVTYKNTNYNSYSGAITIPKTVTYNGTTYTVTTIGYCAFRNSTNLTNVNIPNTVTSIGHKAFYGCSGLTRVYNPNSVLAIGEYAFSFCVSLTSFTIPNSVTYIGDGVFMGCRGLTSVTIPNSVTSIGNAMFMDCSGLTSITIPNSVTSIGNSAFENCSGLTSITIPNSVTSVGNYAFIGTAWYDNQPDGLVYTGLVAYKFKGITPDGTNIIIYDGTQQIAATAFEDCSGLTSITIPNSVTSIGDWAFGGCSSLINIEIPNSVTSIGDNAFWGCSGLTSITIPNSVTSIGYCMFRGCSGLTSITIPNSVTSIGDWAFGGCSSLINIEIPNSVTYIGDNAFYGCIKVETLNFNAVNCDDFSSTASSQPFYNASISTIIIGDSVLRLPAYFANDLTSLTNLTIGKSVTFIGDNVFTNCRGIKQLTWNAVNCTSKGNLPTSSIEQVTIGNEVLVLPDGFVSSSRITEVIIPNSVTSIGGDAFQNCYSLTSIDIPNSVTDIGEGAFECCTNLTRVDIMDLAAWCNISFEYYDANPLYYAHHLYLNNNEVINLEIPSTVTSINNYAFYSCFGLMGNLTIPNSVTRIGYYAFYGCSNLINIEIPNSVTFIGDNAFNNCTGIKQLTWNAVNCSSNGNLPTSSIEQVTIGNEVQVLPYGFVRSSIITEVIIPNSVTSIGGYAFQNCCGLTSINIPNSVTDIGQRAFEGCSGLTSVTIPNSVTSIGYEAFNSCTSLETLNFNAVSCNDFSLSINSHSPFYNLNLSTINIGDNVQRIPAYFAYGLDNLAEITISNSVTSIGYYAFYGCELLGSIEIPNSVTVIGDYAFASCSWLDAVYSRISDLSAVSVGSRMFYLTTGGYSQRTLYVPVGTLSDYQTAFDWRRYFGSIVEMNYQPILVESIELNPSTAELMEGETLQLTASVLPVNASNKTIAWSSSNQAIATVDNNGLVTAIGAGTATIAATAIDGTNLSASCIVTVEAMPQPVLATSIVLNMQACEVNVNESLQLLAEVLPEDADNKTVIWSTSDATIATIDEYGMITGCSTGTAIIAAHTTDGSNLSATCIVTITDELVQSITLNYSELEIQEGGEAYLSATLQPGNVINTTVQWSSSNPRVATVTNKGKVNALEAGTTIVTATTTDGSNLSASCRVTVINPAVHYWFVMPNTEMLRGDTVLVPVMLNNDMEVKAFQTDIFLPTGFSIITDDNNQLCILPSERLTDDHVIMAESQNDGSVRVVCYTETGESIIGNEGDLFYIKIKAPENVSGEYSINLRNTHLTDANYVEIRIPDTGAVLKVNTFIPGDANDSRTVTVTDIVVTAQYILRLAPNPFIYDAANMNEDNDITVTDIMLIAYLINHPTMDAPKRMPALDGGNDCMSGEAVTLLAGETRNVSIQLNNETDYTAFQLDLTLPAGLITSNFQLTDRAGSHALDVNTQNNSKTRVLCYSPAIEVIDGHEGVLLTFDVKATDDIEGIITVDGIELVTADCQTVLMNAFAIGVNSATSVNELNGAKTVARVDYYNLAGQQIDRPESGVTLVVTTYTDGTRSTTKVIK